MDGKFIEERRSMLDKFCMQMAQLPHLYYSDEFKIFLRQTNVDVEKVIKLGHLLFIYFYFFI